MMTRRHLLTTGLTALGSAAVFPRAAPAQGVAGATPDLGLFRPGVAPVPAPGPVSRSAASAPLEIGRVALTVNNIARVQRFYEQVIGLEPLGGSGEVVQLGAGDRVLLELREDPFAKRPSIREAGLYHTAFLMPSRAALGRWVRHKVETGTSIQGASDHLVSEAVYLADPEGNGIEVYADRPRETWAWNGDTIEMDTLPFDGEGVVNAADGPWTGAPAETVVGHVHLQVGDIDDAQDFYAGALGFDVVKRDRTSVFLSSGGYHHHLAANIRNSLGAHPRDFPSTGLADVEIRVEASLMEALLARNGGRPALTDPWGTSVTLRAKAA